MLCQTLMNKNRETGKSETDSHQVCPALSPQVTVCRKRAGDNMNNTSFLCVSYTELDSLVNRGSPNKKQQQ